jgi:hypothetical protein
MPHRDFRDRGLTDRTPATGLALLVLGLRVAKVQVLVLEVIPQGHKVVPVVLVEDLVLRLVVLEARQRLFRLVLLAMSCRCWDSSLVALPLRLSVELVAVVVLGSLLVLTMVVPVVLVEEFWCCQQRLLLWVPLAQSLPMAVLVVMHGLLPRLAPAAVVEEVVELFISSINHIPTAAPFPLMLVLEVRPVAQLE